MIEKSSLEVGSYYFFLTYVDTNLRVPVIETLKYRESSTHSSGIDAVHTFERIGADLQPPMCRLPDDLLISVYDFSSLVAEFDANLEAQLEGRPFNGLE